MCPKCLNQSLEFNERYRLASPGGTFSSTPAWVCDQPTCGFYRRARAEEDLRARARKLRMAAMKLRTLAKRGLVKAKFVSDERKGGLSTRKQR